MKRRLAISVAALLLPAAMLASNPGNPGHASQRGLAQMSNSEESGSHPYVGMWVTADGHIRHELLPNGRYVEARGNRERAYEGRYEVTGDHIEYWDDSGFTADGDFVDGVLHHGGMIFRRNGEPQKAN